MMSAVWACAGRGLTRRPASGGAGHLLGLRELDLGYRVVVARP